MKTNTNHPIQEKLACLRKQNPVAASPIQTATPAPTMAIRITVPVYQIAPSDEPSR